MSATHAYRNDINYIKEPPSSTVLEFSDFKAIFGVGNNVIQNIYGI